jgi:hypothetical protein
MASAYRLHNPLRVPSAIPAPAPATLMSWQGNPPQMMSMGPCSSWIVLHSIVVMSP